MCESISNLAVSAAATTSIAIPPYSKTDEESRELVEEDKKRVSISRFWHSS